MKYIILDTETTGINSKLAEMLSFGAFAIETNSDNKLDFNTLKAIHRFFNTDKEVPVQSTSVHGLTRQILMKKSNGDYLEDCYKELEDFIYQPDAVLVGYNISYDKDIVYYNLVRNGLPAPKWSRTIDVMKEQFPLLEKVGYHSKKWVKLIQASNMILKEYKGYSNEQLKKVLSIIADETGIKIDNDTYHSALWDSFITLFIFKELYDSGIVK